VIEQVAVGTNPRKVQTLTIEELLDGKTIHMPPTGMTFKQAQKVKEKELEQGKLFGE
jgi:hypothetical protein